MHEKPIELFNDREEAGSKLAKRLVKFAQPPNVIVLALPNGGVPVGARIASLLNLPFDVLLMESITAPGCDGLALGAITAGGVRVLDSAMIDRMDLSQAEINAAILRGCQKLARREKSYRGLSRPLEIPDNTVLLVDDGTTPARPFEMPFACFAGNTRSASSSPCPLPVSISSVISGLKLTK